MYMFRKFWTIAIPVAICIGIFLIDLELPTKALPFTLMLALIFQNIVFRFIYSDEIDNFSENLADRMIPQTLNGIFGPFSTAIIAVTGTYILGFSLLLIISLSGLWTPSDLVSWIVLTLCLGMMLSPIMNNILDAHDISDLININSIGAIYFITCMLGVASLSRLTGVLESYVGSSEKATIIILVWTFLLARSHHIIELSFRQKEGMGLFIFSLLPLAYLLVPELVFVSGFL